MTGNKLFKKVPLNVRNLPRKKVENVGIEKAAFAKYSVQRFGIL